ncbi:hypothetical protein HJC23_011306 [Cyclotella cryptica]|uniref:Uncharacterized protein n=1 Tax=Cyclotella cryptica TaxID=29204 RepID=A0ABD3QVB4_9STRA
MKTGEALGLLSQVVHGVLVISRPLAADLRVTSRKEEIRRSKRYRIYPARYQVVSVMPHMINDVLLLYYESYVYNNATRPHHLPTTLPLLPPPPNQLRTQSEHSWIPYYGIRNWEMQF